MPSDDLLVFLGINVTCVLLWEPGATVVKITVGFFSLCCHLRGSLKISDGNFAQHYFRRFEGFSCGESEISFTIGFSSGHMENSVQDLLELRDIMLKGQKAGGFHTKLIDRGSRSSVAVRM